MGKHYIAEKRSEHLVIAVGPDLIIPPSGGSPIPCITYVTLDQAVGTSSNTMSNSYPLYTTGSHVPHCLGGIPGRKGVISGTWNGGYYPDEHSSSIKVEGHWMIFHNHKGKGNG